MRIDAGDENISKRRAEIMSATSLRLCICAVPFFFKFECLFAGLADIVLPLTTILKNIPPLLLCAPAVGTLPSFAME